MKQVFLQQATSSGGEGTLSLRNHASYLAEDRCHSK